MSGQPIFIYLSTHRWNLHGNKSYTQLRQGPPVILTHTGDLWPPANREWMEMPNIDTIERNHSWGQTEQLQQSTHIQTLYTDYIHQWHKENKPVFSRDAQGMGPHNIAPPYEGIVQIVYQIMVWSWVQTLAVQWVLITGPDKYNIAFMHYTLSYGAAVQHCSIPLIMPMKFLCKCSI